MPHVSVVKSCARVLPVTLFSPCDTPGILRVPYVLKVNLVHRILYPSKTWWRCAGFRETPRGPPNNADVHTV